jgi:drug/metabolite transporter (DMT)-like permease
MMCNGNPGTIVSALTYLDPLVAILIDLLISGFVPSHLQMWGIVLIFIALSYMLFNHRSKKGAHALKADRRQVNNEVE